MADFKQNYCQKRTKDRGPKSNNRISSPEVQVIGSDGNNLGILNTNEAITKAKNEHDQRIGSDFNYIPLLGDREPPLDYRKIN